MTCPESTPDIPPAVAPASIPALRGDIEVRERRDGRVELRDPQLLQLLTVSREDYEVAREFDGRAGPEQVRARLAGGRALTADQVAAVARDFARLSLLDTPAARRARPQQDNVAPPSLLDGRRGLNALPVAEPGARWACHGCGACCRGLLVELSPEEDARLDRRLYRDILGDDDYAEEQFISPDQPAKRVLRHQSADDDRCIFLAPDGRCWVHARQGARAKPDACQMFPFLIVDIPRRAPRFGVRVNCLSMHESFEGGPPLEQHTPDAFRLFRDLEVHKAPARVELFSAEVSFAAYDRLVERVRAELSGGVTPEALRAVDRAHLGDRVRRARGPYGRKVLAYISEETESELPTDLGAYAARLAGVKRARSALAAMAERRPPPRVRPRVSAFLKAQLDHALWLCGPLNAPDAGYGLVALMLSLEASMHALAGREDLAEANRAFDAFSSPLLETLDHFWPVLRAIDARYAAQIEKEMT